MFNKVLTYLLTYLLIQATLKRQLLHCTGRDEITGKKCHSESNSFVAAAEQVRLEPVPATKMMSHRLAGRSTPLHQQQEKHGLRLLNDGRLERQAAQWRRTCTNQCSTHSESRISDLRNKTKLKLIWAICNHRHVTSSSVMLLPNNSSEQICLIFYLWVALSSTTPNC